MRLLFEPSTEEPHLEGTAEELYELVRMLRQGREGVYDNLTVARSEDEPYSTCLSQIVLRPVADQEVRIYVESGQNLVITGDVQNIAILADNLVDAVYMPVREHIHIDYFPGIDYISEDSFGLVVQRIENNGPQ